MLIMIMLSDFLTLKSSPQNNNYIPNVAALSLVKKTKIEPQCATMIRVFVYSSADFFVILPNEVVVVLL